FYQFDPTSLTLVKASAKYLGKSKVDIDGKQVELDQLEITDPRAPMSLFINGEGGLVKATGPFGMEMFPETKTIAQDFSKGRTPAAGSDIAEASRLVPDKPITGYL